MTHENNHDPRLLDLLADDATEGLETSERAELEALLSGARDLDPEDFQRLAAELDLALSGASDAAAPLPAALRAKLERNADAFFEEGTSTSASGRRPAAPSAAAARRTPPARASRRGWALAGVGWAAAAAGWMAALWIGLDTAQTVPPSGPSALAQRSTLLDAASDVIEVSWTATDDPAAQGASGDVVWSDTRQEGYMRFRGLAANDPGQSQYQLWIFDASRDDAHPVDGGVFDIPAGAQEVVVPIRSKLTVESATLFAITVERPGGVVVSSRERLPLLAKVETDAVDG